MSAKSLWRWGLLAVVGLGGAAWVAVAKTADRPPNFIIIFADDLGYGDLGCYGHPTIRTPCLDRMAAEGMRFTQFYVGADVCTPSRAALMTGRLPIRYGLAGTPGHDVLTPNSLEGLPHSEITLAQALKARGYHTAILGKWHLGCRPQFMPTRYGFDYYFGLPYSLDMTRYLNWPAMPLYRNEQVIEKDPDWSLLTRRYTQEAIDFIKANREQPFFLYYPNNYPHMPLAASDQFKGRSRRGLYGDAVEELDWSVGEILKTLKALKLDENTLVVFSSDNGPWLRWKEKGGSAGLLYEGKGSTYEGGMREPGIAWWPGTIRPNQVSTALAATMDLFPTFLKLAGAPLPQDRVYDGVDLTPVLTGQAQQVRDKVFYYHQSKLFAVRKGPWKALFTTKPSYSKEPAVDHNPPLLYNLEVDPSEKYDVAKDHPEIVADLQHEFASFKASIPIVPSLTDAELSAQK